MTDFVRSLSSSDGLMPHGMCYLWDPPLLWLHLVSDALIGVAYWAIPPALFMLVWKARREMPDEGPYARSGGLPFEWMFVAFGAFIVACGTTHLMGVWTIWEPRYWLSGGAKAVTAVASLFTAIALPPLVPKAVRLLRDARDSEARRAKLQAANRELEELSENLREADRLKSELVANVSHELRTPLTLILGPAQDLLGRDDLPADVRRGLEVMQRNARSLLGQVDDLLDASRLELDQETPTFEDVDLRSFVEEIVSQFESLARGRRIELELEAPERLPVRVDREMTERILLNLLSNAFKFTPDDGRIRVVLDTRDERVVLEVRDSGPGVPHEARETIFEPFRQAEGGSERRHGGTGLGLSIAWQFVTVQGGSIELDDAPEGGACFTVELPLRAVTDPSGGREDTGPDAGGSDVSRAVLKRARLESMGPSIVEREEALEAEEVGTFGEIREERDDPGEGRGSGKPTEDRESLLLVEDDPGLRDFLAPVLRRSYRVREAADGLEGLRALDRERPDLIVTDMMMPRMDGESFVRRVRERPELADVPIVVLTAKAEPDLVARILQMGAQDYLLKPVGLAELGARIENHLDMARSRRILQDELASREDRLRVLAGEAAERKQRLESLLEEKSVLIQELHHRVKGNLQTITSLLNLQARRLDESGARDVLTQSRGRIAAMALLHERLYQTEDPTETDMSAYVGSLSRDVFSSWSREDSDIRLDLDVEPLQLDAERAVGCGLILHELLTNALRHGFHHGARGSVRVEMRAVGSASIDSSAEASQGASGDPSSVSSTDAPERRAVKLVVDDDGVGFPVDFDLEEGDSLGVSLVSALVGQLGGEANVTGAPDRGVRWEIRFPLEPSKPDSRREEQS